MKKIPVLLSTLVILLSVAGCNDKPQNHFDLASQLSQITSSVTCNDGRNIPSKFNEATNAHEYESLPKWSAIKLLEEKFMGEAISLPLVHPISDCVHSFTFHAPEGDTKLQLTYGFSDFVMQNTNTTQSELVVTSADKELYRRSVVIPAGTNAPLETTTIELPAEIRGKDITIAVNPNPNGVPRHHFFIQAVTG